jgi:hypothetical protein
VELNLENRVWIVLSSARIVSCDIEELVDPLSDPSLGARDLLKTVAVKRVVGAAAGGIEVMVD